MNIEKLVPPPELCKKIPEGEFEDAAFAWHYTDMVGFVCRTSGCEQVSGKEWQIVPSNASRIIRARKRGEQIFPAPMLEEIFDKCKDIPCVLNPTLWWQGIWKADCAIDKSNKLSEEFLEDADLDNLDLVCSEDKNPSTAALKLWMDLKGIEDGE